MNSKVEIVKIENKKIDYKEPEIKYPIYRDNDFNIISDNIDVIFNEYNAKDIPNTTLDIDVQYSSKLYCNVTFSISVLEHCCGVLEIGDLRVTKTKISELTKILDSLVKNIKGITFIINTNGKGASIVYEQVLANCEYFTLVKTFKNANSGNIIKMWISNNE